jgi:hypothetical protein
MHGDAGKGGEARDRLRISASEKEFWSAVWRQAPFPMWEECGVDLVRFGPIRAACMAEHPDELGLNFILGSSEAGAVEHGHLADAVAWLETRPLPTGGTGVAEDFGVDFRVPIVPGLPDAAAAEGWLQERGALRQDGPARLVRSTSPPDFPIPAGIEVLSWEDWDEGFPEPLVESLELPSGYCFFVGLPVEDDDAWRCFGAVDDYGPLAYAAMHLDSGVATLVFASRPSDDRDGAGQIALLHRCIGEAAEGGCDLIAVTDAGHEPPVIDRECLVRAGFEVAFQMPTWRSRVEVDV